MQDEKNFTINEDYTLPSKGRLYSPAFDPRVKLRSMTVQEEMKRTGTSGSTNRNLAEVVDDCLVHKLPISSYDLFSGDFEYLVHKLRVVTYGPEYKMIVTCPYCGKTQTYTLNLDDLTVDEYDELKQKEFEDLRTFKLPKSGKQITLRLPTPRLEDIIDDKVREHQASAPDDSRLMRPVFLLETMIESIDGERMNTTKLSMLIQKMQLADYNKIINRIAKLNTFIGVSKDINNIKCNGCKGIFRSRFRATSEFFGPQDE